MSRFNRILAKAPPILLILSMVYIGFLGIISADFGQNWDEPRLIGSLQNTVRSGLLLPRWYQYPSVSYDVGMLCVAPHMAMRVARSWGTDHGGKRDALARYLGEPAFKFQLRSAFFVLCILSAIPVYILARCLSGSNWIALFAALTAISTWEFLYHARWIAPDGLVALFASGSALCQYQILNTGRVQSRRLFWIILSAIFAGLCLGTKYPGGIVLVPLILAIALSHGRREWTPPAVRVQVKTAILVAIGTFLLTTPGCFLEPLQFLRDVGGEMVHYSRGHGGYTVNRGGEHLTKLCMYCVSVLFSRNSFLAVGASLSAALGAAYLLTTQARIGFWFLSLPVVYIVYMSSQRVMIVRNYLILLPFLAVLAAVGLFAVIRRIGNRGIARFLLCSAAVLFTGYNLVVATRSSLGIFRHHASSARQAVETRIISSPETKFFLSSAILKLLEGSPVRGSANIVDTVALADRFIFHSEEVTDWKLFRANTAGRYRTVWSDVEEVNWDFYPSWKGPGRVLEVSATESELERLRDHVIRTQGSSPVDAGKADVSPRPNLRQ